MIVSSGYIHRVKKITEYDTAKLNKILSDKNYTLYVIRKILIKEKTFIHAPLINGENKFTRTIIFLI